MEIVGEQVALAEGGLANLVVMSLEGKNGEVGRNAEGGEHGEHEKQHHGREQPLLEP